MRIIRMLFVALLALALITLALANRGIVTVRAFPANMEAWLGGDWSVAMPLFLVIFLAMLIGMVLGLIWEWMRESQVRAENARRAREIAELEREVGTLRARNVQPRDEVLAILDRADAARPAARPAAAPAASVPARR